MSERTREIDRQQGERNVRQVPMEISGVLPYLVVHELIHLTQFSHSLSYCACVTDVLVFATDHVSVCVCCVPVSAACVYEPGARAASAGAGRVADSDRGAGHWVMEYVPVESASH